VGFNIAERFVLLGQIGQHPRQKRVLVHVGEITGVVGVLVGQHLSPGLSHERRSPTAPARGSQRSGRSLWADHHHHLAAFQARHGFHLAGIADIGSDPVQKLKTKLLVRHFTATEAKRDFDLVALFEELQHRAHLHVVIMGIGSGTELDFLDLDDLLFLAGFGFALLGFVFELAEIHDLADRRLGVRRNLDQIETGFFGHCHCAGGGHHTDIFAISPDETDFRGTDAFIDTGAGFALWRGIVGSASYGGVPYMVADEIGRKIDREGGAFQPGFASRIAFQIAFQCGGISVIALAQTRKTGKWQIARSIGKECRMNRNVIIALIVAVLALGGYYYYSGQQQAAEEAAAAQKAAEDAAAAAKKAEEEAAAKAAEEAAAAQKAAEEAAAAAAASTAATAATDAAADAAATATEAATDAANTAADAAATATDAAATAAADLFDAAKFDAEKLVAAIDGSTLDDATKTTLKSAVDAAKADPSLVQTALDQIKKALGM
jgi:hypothetical protein